jgi:two-component system response regulator MtrA
MVWLMAHPSAPALVLVVEDEPAIADVIRLYLDSGGYRTQVIGDGIEALRVARSARPAAIVLDVGLPGLDGVQICRTLRGEQNWTPILFLTARDDEVDRIVGLELGADDYITKPFSPRELLARVTSVLRRIDGVGRPEDEPATGPTLAVGSVRVELGSHRVFADGAEVSLTATEFELLAHLMRRPGWVFRREQLLTDVWGHQSVAGTRTVDVHIAQLRGKLGAASPVRTVRGVGYSAES